MEILASTAVTGTGRRGDGKGARGQFSTLLGPPNSHATGSLQARLAHFPWYTLQALQAVVGCRDMQRTDEDYSHVFQNTGANCKTRHGAICRFRPRATVTPCPPVSGRFCERTTLSPSWFAAAHAIRLVPSHRVKVAHDVVGTSAKR